MRQYELKCLKYKAKKAKDEKSFWIKMGYRVQTRTSSSTEFKLEPLAL